VSINKILGLFSLAFISLFTLQTGCWAASTEIESKFWANFQLSGPLSADKTWHYYLEPQLRFVDDPYKFNQANLYAGVYKTVTASTSLWIGVMRRFEIKSDGDVFLENRLWEQMVAELYQRDRVKIVSRSRFEQRKNVDSAVIANRFREKLTLQIPIAGESGYFIELADEVFFQLNQPEWVTQRVFSENRATIGLEIPINKIARYEVGYLNQYQYSNPRQVGNVVFVNLIVGLN
jgi:hypothetical protein